MENTTTESVTTEAAQIITETEACATVLSTMIQRQNEVVLSCCRALIDNTLNAVSTLQSIQQSGSGTSIPPNMEQWQSQLLQAIKDSTETLKNAIPADAGNASIKLPEITEIPKNQPLQSFINASSIFFANAVASQQQLNTITQAATVQTLNVILSTATANTVK